MGKYLKKFNTDAEYQTYAQSGDMIKPNVSHCVTEYHVHYNPIPHDYSKDYLTFVAKESGTFTFTPQSDNVINYSTDNGKTWTVGNSVEVDSGAKVMWRVELTPSSSDGVGTFSATGNFDAQGNVMSLLYGDNFKGQTDLTEKNYVFYQLFYENTKIISAENLSLPATTLAERCYENMFGGCTSLVNAPVLPATTLASSCYISMFNGCTKLKTAPELPAKTLAEGCYYNMFYGCTSLTTAPELPATTLAEYCYSSMFNGCTSLTTAPELPATTLTDYCYGNMFSNTNVLPDCSNIDFTSETVVGSGGLKGLFASTKVTDSDLERILPKNANGKYCLPATTLADGCYYSMFYGCTSLTTAPELPATTLAERCYDNMFSDCRNLTTAPELPATTLAEYCYRYMFNGCTSLNYIKAMFTTTPSTTYTKNWVSGVSASGTFVKNSAAQWDVTGNNGVPNGWTIETASA